MKIIKFILLICLLSSTTAFSQPEEIHSFADTSGGYFKTIFMDTKVADGIIIAGLHNVNNTLQPVIVKLNVAGEVVWSATTPSPLPPSTYWPNMTFKLFEDGYVYASCYQYLSLQLLWKVNAQTGEVAWIVPFASNNDPVRAFTEIDSTRFAAVYETQLAIFNKATGTMIQQSQFNTTGAYYCNTALDDFGNLYLSFNDQVRKYNGTDLNQILWQRSYLDGSASNHLDEIHQMHLDSSGDIYLMGRNGNTFNNGDGLIARIDPFTGDLVWKVIAVSGDIHITDFVDRNGCIYATYQHSLVSGSASWQTARVAKNTGQVLWSINHYVTPQANASTDITLGQAALSLDIDCNGDVYQTGYYGSANYAPGNWGIMKLNGADGTKLYDLTIAEDSTAEDNESEGIVVALFGNTPVILGQVEIGSTYESKSLYVSINPVNGTIVSRHDIMAGYSNPSYVADIQNDGSSTFELKQVGFALKVKHHLNGNPTWEAAIPGSDITFGKKLAVSTSSVYVFGRKVLSSATSPFYQQATNQLALYKIDRTNGTIQNTQLISAIPSNSRPLELVADNAKSYLFYSKGDSIYYRSWNGTSLSSELLLDSLSQYQFSSENMSIIHNEAARLIVATGSGVYQIDKSTMVKTPFLAYPQPMEITSVSGTGDTLYIAGRSGADALAASINLTDQSINWLTTYPTADNFTRISTDGYFLYVSATDGSMESVRQLALADGAENWTQTIAGGGNTVSSLTLTPANNHDYVVVGGKITEPTGGSNAFITLISYGGTLLENYLLDDELGADSYLSTSAAVNDSSIWIGGMYNTAVQPKSGRIFSVAYTAPAVIQTLNDSACYSYTWPATGATYTTSGVYSQTITNPVADTVLNLNLTILSSSTSSITVGSPAAYIWPVNGQTYTTSGTYVDTIPNTAGCDSIITLNLTIYPANVNVFVMPSDIVECTGAAAFTLSGVPDFTIDIGNGNPFTTSGYAYFDSLCPGIYSAFITDGDGDTLSADFVIPSDSNYVFNNPFVDSLALDSLGTVVSNCDIYYNSIDSAYIADIFTNADTVTVTWEIVDSSGVTSIVTFYVLGNGAGVYDLQLSIFCPQKSAEEYFTVTQAVYFDGSEVHLLGIEDLSLMDVGIYPNPTTNLVKIVFTQVSFDLRIYDSSGKVISEHKLNSGQQISLAQMQSGVYFFDLRSNNGEHLVKRVVKN
jgi:hypothetical protein